MGTGYTRQSLADIQPGQDITASPLNAEFNLLQSAFDASTGHSHDGTTGEGPQIDLTTSVTGILPVLNGGSGGVNNTSATVDPTVTDDSASNYAAGSVWVNVTDDQLFVCLDASVGAAIWGKIPKEISGIIAPEATNTVDIGSASLKYKDAYLSGTLSTAFIGATTASGTWDMDGNTLTDLPLPVATSDAATKGYVDTAVANLIDSAPATLDTLNELAAALGDDPNFSTTITASIATKLPLAGGTMTGNIAMGTNKITGLGAPTNANDATTKTYVDAILGSATDAATSAAAALVSETNAANSEANAAASYDSFDDRYLGAKASDPTLDNDGDALITGAIYWNTSTNQWRVYNGSAWETAVSSLTYDGARPYSVITSSQAVTPDNRYLVDTSGGAVTVTLPASPANGDTIDVLRVGASDVVIARNGNQLFGSATDHTIDVDYAGWTLVYSSVTGWEGSALNYPATTNTVILGPGSIIGPASATDNALVQFDGTTGELAKVGPSIGTSANNLVQLDGSARLPAVDGSQLTNLPVSSTIDLINETTVSSPVASVEWTGLDTSTYDSFIVQVFGASHNDAGNQYIYMQFSPDTGSTWRTTGYQGQTMTYQGPSSAAISQAVLLSFYQDTAAAFLNAEVKVQNLGNSSLRTFVLGQSISEYVAVSAIRGSSIGAGYDTAEAHDSIRIIPQGGSLDAGTYKIFGVK